MLTNTLNAVAIFVLSSKFVALVCTCLLWSWSSVSVTLFWWTFLKVLVFPYTLHWGEVLSLYWQMFVNFNSLHSVHPQETKHNPLFLFAANPQCCSSVHSYTGFNLRTELITTNGVSKSRLTSFIELVSLYLIRGFHCVGNEDQIHGCDDVWFGYLLQNFQRSLLTPSALYSKKI
jgi:hypothetical protein